VLEKQHNMLTEIGAALLAEAFPSALRVEAQTASSHVKSLMTTSQWTDRFGVLVYGEQVLLPHRIQFKPEKVDFERGSETWLMVRALQSRSNDGFQRQRAVRDLLTDIRPWTAPFVVALIGEYIAEILIDIDAAMLPGSVAVITEFISANPGYWQTIERRVQSYFNVYHQRVYGRSDYVGFRLIEKFETERVSRLI